MSFLFIRERARRRRARNSDNFIDDSDGFDNRFLSENMMNLHTAFDVIVLLFVNAVLIEFGNQGFAALKSKLTMVSCCSVLFEQMNL